MGKQYKTQLSSGASTERNKFKRPDRILTGEKLHKCQHCSYTCRYNYRLKIHGRVHTGEKPFKCRHCSFKTAYKSRLKTHEHKHTGEKPYKCRHCPFKTAHKSSLKEHQLWHTGDRPYKCSLCPFTTFRKSHLEIHERVHTGERPFKCQHCPYVATQRQHLIIHARKHSGEGPFKCQHCSYSSTHIQHLKTHQKIHIRGNLSKLEHPARLRSSLASRKRLQSGRKPLNCKIPPETVTVLAENYGNICDLVSSRKQCNREPTHLQDLLEGEEESYCQDTQLDSSDDHEINKFSNFEIFICKECNYALFSEKELCMHYSFCHKLPVVSLNTERTDCTIQQ